MNDSREAVAGERDDGAVSVLNAGFVHDPMVTNPGAKRR
jgi:hypothetical protein